MRLGPLVLIALVFVAACFQGCSDQDPDQPAVGSITVEGDRALTLDKKGKVGKTSRSSRP